MPRVIEVIEADEEKGSGVMDSPYRRVKRYYTLDGDLLAENDQWLPLITDDDIKALRKTKAQEAADQT
jgi:hypothetical protein